MRNLPKLLQSLGHVHDAIYRNLESRDSFRTVLTYTIPGHPIVLEIEIERQFRTHRTNVRPYHTIQLFGKVTLLRSDGSESFRTEPSTIFTKQTDAESNFVPWIDNDFDRFELDTFASRIIARIGECLDSIDTHGYLAFQRREMVFEHNPQPSFLDINAIAVQSAYS